MKIRSLTALAATTIVAAAFTPLTANAATATVHSSSISGVHSSAIGNLLSKAKAKPSVSHATTTGPVTATLTATAGGALSVGVTGSGTTTASGATITSVTYQYGDGTAATTTATHTYGTAGTFTITATVTDSDGNTGTTSVSFTTMGSDYTAYGPTRILDTRTGTGTNGTIAKVGADSTLKLKVAGAGIAGDTMPSGVTAVVMTLTVTNPTAAGYITAYDDGESSAPTTSSVNYAPGQTIPNLVVVPVGADGYVDLYNASKGSTDLVADVSGYFTQTSGNQYVAIPNYRLLDTRTGTGVGGTAAKVAADGTITVTVAGADGGTLPSTGIQAVALNLTETNATQAGFLTAYPSGSALPNSSNVNFAAGQTVPDEVIVPVGPDGKIKIYNASKGTTDVVADVAGYFTPPAGSSVKTSAFVPMPPQRILDTRDPSSPTNGPLAADSYYDQVPIAPAVLAPTSVVVNATVTDSQTNGYVTLYPSNSTSSTPPNSSNVNFAHNQTVANLDIATLGTTEDTTYSSYDLGILNASAGTTDLILDLTGYFSSN